MLIRWYPFAIRDGFITPESRTGDQILRSGLHPVPDGAAS